MKRLLEKLKNNSITPEELKLLRDRIYAMTDQEVAEIFYFEDLKNHNEDDFDESLTKIKKRIITKIDRDRRKSYPFRINQYWSKIAAFIALPLLGAIAVILYFNINSDSDEIAYNLVCTPAVNDTRIYLSDSTHIKLLPNSTLRYPSQFKGNKRTVEFEGAGFFEVAKNEHAPFIVELPGVEILVKGTTFGINARENCEFTRITLYEGSICFTSNVSHEQIMMVPGSMAKINNRNGDVLIQPLNPNISVDWKTDEIKFNNITPDSLIAQIEEYYYTKLPAYICTAINSNFTGTLPLDDLQTTLKVLEGLYLGK